MTFTIEATKQGGVSFRQQCVPHDRVMDTCAGLTRHGFTNVQTRSEDENGVDYMTWMREQERNFQVGVCAVAAAFVLLATAAWVMYKWTVRGEDGLRKVANGYVSGVDTSKWRTGERLYVVQNGTMTNGKSVANECATRR